MSELNPSHHKPGELAVSVQQLGLIYRTTIDKKASLPNRIRSLGRGTKQTRIVNALNGVNLDVDYGSVLGVIGANGAGKSTLINLVIGFLKPSKGLIELDGFNLQDLDLRSVRKSISVVPQESILFDGTIKENIAYGLKGIDDAQVIKALKDANALGFVEQLPEGLNTLVGDRGAKLSGGQKQRLAIARALIRQPKILILDEATSALDSESESLIQKAISEILKDKTTFVVAHRLSTVRNATKILVLDHGKIEHLDHRLSLRGRPGPPLLHRVEHRLLFRAVGLNVDQLAV